VSSKHSVPEATRITEVARLELTRFAPDAALDQVFCRACELCADALEVERVGVWLFIDDGATLRCANLFERSKREHSAGAMLRVADFPAYFASLTIRKAVPAEVATTESWTAELAASYLIPLGITSTLDAGIFVSGALVGVVCHENVGPPREWSTEARDFAGSVADMLAMRIQSAQVRELRAAFLTHRERTAAQDKEEALEHLAAGVAHDFKNLLTVFLGFGGLLSARADLPDDAREQAKQIVAAAQRGVALATELLEFARTDGQAPIVHDLANLTAELHPVLQATVGAQHRLRYARPPLLGQVLIDKTQYMRLLLNLVVNAREAMPVGGPIDLRLHPVKLTGNPSYSGRFVLLEVTDCGSGMDEATRRRIFEPYFTTKHKGTGLGLAVVRQIVERAGGLIRVVSTPGQGTTFRIFFPRIGSSSAGTIEIDVPPELREDLV
jgi:signal transduction histidine kinase